MDFLLIFLLIQSGEKALVKNFGFIFVVGIGIVLFAIVMFFSMMAAKQQKERREALRKIATQNGWGFAEAADLPFLREFASFLGKPGQDALNGQSINVISGQMRGRKIAVFDQKYVYGYGKGRQTYYQTFFAIELPNANLPVFCAEPDQSKDFFSFFATEYRLDINFGDFPVFSNNYVLHGPNEEQIRRLFTRNVLDFYQRQPLFTCVGGGKYLLMYQHGHTYAVEKILPHLEFIFTLADVFRRR